MPNRISASIYDATTNDSKFILKTSNSTNDLSTPESSETFKFISSHRDFSKITLAEQKALANVSRIVEINTGQYISTEGEDEGPFGYILVSGSLAVSKTSVNGKELIVELLQPGDVFGLLLMLALKKLPMQLSTRALEKSKVLWMPIRNFKEVIKENIFLLDEHVAHLLICLQSSYGLSRGLAHDRVEVRIAAILVSLALKFSGDPETRKNAIIHFTRQQIADLTGTTPETAIRVTRAMQRKGIIEMKHPGVIKILDQEALEMIIDE